MFFFIIKKVVVMLNESSATISAISKIDNIYTIENI